MKDSTENEVLKMIKIISDSTCDLSQEVLERYDIDIIPLHIVKGDEELEDGPQIDIHALYEWADKNKTTPKTSAPSIETAMNVMRPYIDEGREIICFSISSEMSTSINVIRMAAEELDAEDKVTVIDSRNLSIFICYCYSHDTFSFFYCIFWVNLLFVTPSKAAVTAPDYNLSCPKDGWFHTHPRSKQ